MSTAAQPPARTRSGGRWGEGGGERADGLQERFATWCAGRIGEPLGGHAAEQYLQERADRLILVVDRSEQFGQTGPRLPVRSGEGLSEFGGALQMGQQLELDRP